MRVLYLASTRDDITWMRRYYRDVFPAGAAKARDHLRLAESLLTQNPMVGLQAEISGLRMFQIPRTPFGFLYRITAAHIEVIRVFDARADRSGLPPSIE
jgi:toxin ParE1/3/4